MKQTLYDYKAAYGRIQELRRRVIGQKNGLCVEGLTEIELENEQAKKITPKKIKSQEND